MKNLKTLLAITISVILSSQSNAMTCYKSIRIDTLGEQNESYTSRYVTRINGQLFYKSTGLNSSLSGIYFPFYGILSINNKIPFWYIKPGHGELNVDDKSVNTKTPEQIWDSYKYSEFGTFMNHHDMDYIEQNLHKSEAQLRFGGYEAAKTSYEITDSSFSNNLNNPFVAELNSYFENIIKLQKTLSVNTLNPIKSFIQSKPDSFDSANKLANEINLYIENSPNDWACSSSGCCEIY